MNIERRDLLAGLALALACPAFERPAFAATPGLRRSRNRLFAPALVAGQRMEALLDSGAEYSVLHTATAATLGLGRRIPARGTGTGGAFNAYLTAPVPLTVAGVNLGLQRLAVTDLSDISRRLIGAPLTLIAGRQLLDSGRFLLDTTTPSLARVPRAARPPGIPLPLSTRRGLETLPVAVEGRIAQAEFDIGNGNEVLVHARVAQALGWLTDGRAVETVGGAGGLGGPVNRRLTTARTLTVAGQTFENVPVGIDDQPTGADVNLSTQFLDAFRLTLDYPQKRIWFAPR